jgi:cystinosin
MVRSESLQVLSAVIGWIYFTAWSVSFYPQIILNYQRKSVDGMSFEFLAYNITGFLYYFIFSTTTFAIRQKNPPQTVDPNDIAYAAHAVLVTLVTISQCFIYPRRGQKFSKLHRAIVALIWISTVALLIAAATGSISWYSLGSDHFNFLEFLGDCKLFISFVKYVPQAYLNYLRQSTVGWPIQNIFLDLTGGIGSFLQQYIDAYNKDNYALITSNIPKFMLAIESVCFDILFLVQHFILYRGNKPRLILPDVQDPILSEESRTGTTTTEHSTFPVSND